MTEKAVLLTRPEEDARESAAALEARGIEGIVAPLIEIEVRNETPPLSGVRAILATSANGIRAFARQSDKRDLPVFAVGDASARTARDLGFAQVESAQGNVDDLAALVKRQLKPGAGRLLHPVGSAVAGDLAAQLSRAGYDVRRYVAYASRAVRELPQLARWALNDSSVVAVMLYSPRTAEIFRELVTEAGLANDCRFLNALCLSEAVEKALSPLAFRDILVAERPEQDALFALLDAQED